MKHFFTLLSAIALTSAISVNAQNLHPLNQHGRSFEPKSLSEVRMPASQQKGMRKAPGIKVMKAAAVTELSGPAMVVYESTSVDDEGETIPFIFYYGIDIENNGDGTITMSGFGQWLTDSDVNDITAKLDEDGNFEMDSQVLFTNSNFGKVSIAAWDYDEEAEDIFPVRDAKITGSFIDGGLYFDTPWGIFIDEGEYKDYYFDLAFSAGILKATGVMTDTDQDGTYKSYIVHNIENDTIYVGGFSGMGESAVMTYDLSKKTVTIPNQRAFYYGSDYGVFYTYALNTMMTSVESIDISGTFTESQISWGPWAQLNANGRGFLYKGSKIDFFEGYNLIEDITSVKQVETSKNIARNKFYNVQGIETAQPQKGVNIQVTEYTDGSKKTVKILK